METYCAFGFSNRINNLLSASLHFGDQKLLVRWPVNRSCPLPLDHAITPPANWLITTEPGTWRPSATRILERKHHGHYYLQTKATPIEVRDAARRILSLFTAHHPDNPYQIPAGTLGVHHRSKHWEHSRPWATIRLALNLATSRNLHHALILCDDQAEKKLIAQTLQSHGLNTTVINTSMRADMDRTQANTLDFIHCWIALSQCQAIASNFTTSTIPDLARCLGREVWSIGSAQKRNIDSCSLFGRFNHGIYTLTLDQLRNLPAARTHTQHTNHYPEQSDPFGHLNPPDPAPTHTTRATPLIHSSFDTLPQHLSRIISFSLFGDHPIYNTGIVKNAQLARSIYPEHTLLVFIDHTQRDDSIFHQLTTLGAQIIHLKHLDIPTICHRFIPLASRRFSHVLVRDADSRLNLREQAATLEWEMSQLPVHIMRDHPAQIRAVTAGAFSAHGGILPDIINSLRRFTWSNRYGQDEDFLTEHLWHPFKNQALIHQAHHTAPQPDTPENLRRFTHPLPAGQFICQRFNENDVAQRAGNRTWHQTNLPRKH